MNGKQAKRLRRAAIGLAVTLTEAGKVIKKDGYQEVRTVNAPEHNPKGLMSGEQPPGYAVQYKVRPDSVKGIYRTLKSKGRS